MPISPLAVTQEGAAALLSMDAATFAEGVADGLLPSPIRLAGHLRWRVSDLLSEVNKGRHELPPLDGGPFLSPREVSALSGVSRRAGAAPLEEWQSEALEQMRVPHYINAKGRLMVLRSAVEQGLKTEAKRAGKWKLDLSKIR